MVIFKLPSLGREARNKKGVRPAGAHAVEDAFVCADTFVGSAYPAKQAACQFSAWRFAGQCDATRMGRSGVSRQRRCTMIRC